MLKEWLIGRWDHIVWSLFLLLGLIGGGLTVIHPVAVISIVVFGVGYIFLKKYPEVFIPLYVFSGYYKSIVPGPDITLVFFALALLAVCLKIYENSEMVEDLFRTSGITPMISFLFLIVLSLVYTSSSAAAIEKTIKVILLTGGAFFFPLFLIRNVNQLRNVLLAIVCLGTSMSFTSVVTGERSVFGSNYLSLGFISSLSIIIFLFYFYGKMKHPLLFVPIVINLIAMLNSAARGPVFFLPITFFLTIMLSKLKFQKKVRTYIIFVAFSILSLIVLYIIVPQSFETLLMRLDVMEDSEDDANSQYRAYHIEHALSLLRSHPLTGVGIGAYGMSSEGIDDSRIYPHNILLEIGAELGIFGLALFTLIIVQVLAHYFMHRGALLYVDNTLIACMFYGFINTLKAGNLVDNRTFFLLLGLMLTTHWMREEGGERNC